MWYLDIPTEHEIRALAELQESAVVSLYLPSTPITPDAQAEALAFRNLADEAVATLEKRPGLERADVEAITQQLTDLVDDSQFWATQANGLGVIATPERHWTFRLPHAPSPGAHVADRVHLLPLLAAGAQSQDCHVLCLSEGGVRLVDVAANLPPQEVRVPNLPVNAEGEVGPDSVSDRTFSKRLVGDEGKRVLVRQFARGVDDALRPLLRGDDRPLVLVAPRPIDSMFRQLCSYPHLLAEGVQANPDRWSLPEIAEAVQPVLLTHQANLDAELAGLLEARRGEGRVLEDMADIARAATAGAVDTLIVDRDNGERGLVADSGALALDPAGGLVVDELARRTVLTGGRVLAVEAGRLPGASPTTAVLRYTL